MRRLAPSVIVVLALLLNACSVPKLRLPRVYKQNVQQGNVLTQDMIDQLRPGMTRSQVAFIMGEPVFRNPFDDNRWDYVYSIEVPGVFNQQQRVSLFFVEEELTYITGDVVPSRFLNKTVDDPANEAPGEPGDGGPAAATGAAAAAQAGGGQT